MTEFERRRQLRELRLDIEPAAHVWPGIASRIGADAVLAMAIAAPARDLDRARRYFGWPALAAAAVVVATLAIAPKVPAPRPSLSDIAGVAPAAPALERSAPDRTHDRLAADLARNPVLAATDAELRELQEQLQRALDQQPESTRLRGMLMRTEDERRRLLQYQSQLG